MQSASTAYPWENGLEGLGDEASHVVATQPSSRMNQRSPQPAEPPLGHEGTAVRRRGRLRWAPGCARARSAFGPSPTSLPGVHLPGRVFLRLGQRPRSLAARGVGAAESHGASARRHPQVCGSRSRAQRGASRRLRSCVHGTGGSRPLLNATVGRVGRKGAPSADAPAQNGDAPVPDRGISAVPSAGAASAREWRSCALQVPKRCSSSSVRRSSARCADRNSGQQRMPHAGERVAWFARLGCGSWRHEDGDGR